MIAALDVVRSFWYAGRHRQAARDDVVSFQDAQLRRLIARAHANVPYYRTLFRQHGVKPTNVKTAADLARIPVTSRRDLQGAPPSALLARGLDPARLIVHDTSGSTGEPLHMRRTWLAERITTAFHLRALRDFGVRSRDTRVWLMLPRRADPQSVVNTRW